MVCSCCVLSVALFLIGCYSLLHAVFQPVLRFILRFCKTRQPFQVRFGKWAIVTGSTDGIGKAIALELAQKGMNLLLVSRSEERLNETKQQIYKKFSDSSVETFVFDFSNAPWSDCSKTSLSQLSSVIDTLDVGLLVNNVGLSYPSALRFDELPEGLIDDLITVNLRSVFHLTQLVLPGMRKRHRGAILCIGSGASRLPSEPLYAAYAGVKSAVEAFCRSLQVECVSDDILVQCQTPLLVTTKLSRIKTTSLTVPTPQAYASSAVKMLENARPSYWISPTTSPNLIHSTILFLSHIIPLGIWNRVRFRMTSSLRLRYLKKVKAQ